MVFHNDYGRSRRDGHKTPPSYGLGYLWEGTAGRIQKEHAIYNCNMLIQKLKNLIQMKTRPIFNRYNSILQCMVEENGLMVADRLINSITNILEIVSEK